MKRLILVILIPQLSMLSIEIPSAIVGSIKDVSDLNKRITYLANLLKEDKLSSLKKFEKLKIAAIFHTDKIETLSKSNPELYETCKDIYTTLMNYLKPDSGSAEYTDSPLQTLEYKQQLGSLIDSYELDQGKIAPFVFDDPKIINEALSAAKKVSNLYGILNDNSLSPKSVITKLNDSFFTQREILLYKSITIGLRERGGVAVDLLRIFTDQLADFLGKYKRIESDIVNASKHDNESAHTMLAFIKFAQKNEAAISSLSAYSNNKALSDICTYLLSYKDDTSEQLSKKIKWQYIDKLSSDIDKNLTDLISELKKDTPDIGNLDIKAHDLQKQILLLKQFDRNKVSFGYEEDPGWTPVGFYIVELNKVTKDLENINTMQTIPNNILRLANRLEVLKLENPLKRFLRSIASVFNSKIDTINKIDKEIEINRLNLDSIKKSTPAELGKNPIQKIKAQLEIYYKPPASRPDYKPYGLLSQEVAQASQEPLSFQQAETHQTTGPTTINLPKFEHTGEDDPGYEQEQAQAKKLQGEELLDIRTTAEVGEIH